MRRKQSLICSALSIASILSMSVPAMAAEPVDVPDVAAAETRVVEETASMKVGDVIDLGDGLTAIVRSVKNEISPSNNARSYDTYNNNFTYNLALYQVNSIFIGTVDVCGILTYCPREGWAQYDSPGYEPELYSSINTSITRRGKTISGNGSSVVTAQLDGSVDGRFISNFKVLVKGYSNGQVNISQKY